MPEIVTITFNPCIDKSTTVPALLPEKKLRCTVPKFEPGGGGINVSKAIKNLGGDSIALFPSGGYSGKFLQKLLTDAKINFLPVEITSHTRENLIVFENSTSAQYRFGMPGPQLLENEFQDCLAGVKKLSDVKYIVVSGSFPSGTPKDVFKEIAQVAQRVNAKLIVDTSGEALKQAIQEGVYLIKPNFSELAAITDNEKIKPGEEEKICKEIIAEGKCKVIVVSLGAEGAILVTENKSIRFVPPKVDKKSTVGAGDSMVAGIVFSLQKGKTLEDAVRFGIGCGTAATMNAGTELCHKKDVEALYPLIKVFQDA
jgi:6-phosphofructokinase 2